jgi:transposase
MNLDLASLPDNQSISKQQALLLLHQQEENFQTQQEKYQAQIDYLEEQLRLLRNELFGRKSEKPPREDHDQIPLFGKQAEVLDDVPEPEEEGVVIPSHSRRKRGRKPLPDHLPRVDVIHDLSDDEKMCACGHVMSCIGQETYLPISRFCATSDTSMPAKIARALKATVPRSGLRRHRPN